MGGRDERIVSMLDHARCETQRGNLGYRVEVAQYCIAAPPPTSLILSVSTRAMISAMALPALIEQALTSSGVKPTCDPMMVTATRRAAVISVLLTVNSFIAVGCGQVRLDRGAVVLS